MPPPAAQSPQQRWAMPSEWDAVRATVTRLYKDENRKLEEVMAIMQRDHNFYATYV